MLITKEFLDTNTTPKGGYNRAQLAVVGVSWPAPKGWKKRLVGQEITAEQEVLFKLAAVGDDRKSSLKAIFKLIDSATDEELKLILSRINKRLNVDPDQKTIG